MSIRVGISACPTLRLVGDRAVEPRSGRDWTAALEAASAELLPDLGGVAGFVLKSRSPSCGMARGVFARALRARYPLLPVEEEGRLRDAGLRESFLHAVFAYARWQSVASDGGVRRGDLVEFHTRHKYLLLAHDPARYRDLGRLVAGAKHSGDPRRVADSYARGLMDALRRPAPVPRHVNVLQHIAGHLRGRIGAAERAELGEAIRDYGDGIVSRSVPIALLRHHARRSGVEYIARQVYLQPCPKSLRSGAVLA